MSYAIVRMQKFQKPGVKGIQIHDNREKNSKTNPDIDKSRKDANYSFIACENWPASVKSRVESLKTTKAVRKDAVVMCQIMVTSDASFFKTLTPEREKEFFQQAYNFIADRYGRENIIAATVHKDEKTPHLHVNFTPIQDEKLAAKSIFDRKGLHSLHNEFHRLVGQAWGLQRGESREEKRKHLDTEAFKHKTRMDAMRKEAELARLQIEQARAELAQVKGELSDFQGVREGTAKAMANAQAVSIEKNRQEVERRQQERQEQERARQAPSRGPRMGR